MAFTGAWKAKHFSVDPDQRLHTAGADHVRDFADPNPTWDAPGDMDQVPMFVSEVPHIDWMLADTDGIDFDRTPDSHDAEYRSAMLAPNEGASRQDTFAPPLFQASDERYLSSRFEGLGESPIPTEALRRGLNGDPLNNPEGFRRGWVEQFLVDRKLYDPQRVHDRRMVRPNTADVVTDQPSQPATFGNPFSGLARAMTSISQRPMVRREPPPIDESILTDGSEDTYDAYPEWVVG